MDQEQTLRRPVEDGAPTEPTSSEHQLPPPLEPPTDDNSALHFGHKSNPPPAYTQLNEVDTPTTELPPIQAPSDAAASSNHSLPSLSSVTGPQPQLFGSPRTTEPSYSPEPLKPTQWPSMNPLTTFYAPSHAQASDSPQMMDVDSGSNGRASSVSLDDPDVRMAAEALGDLRADFISSPPKGHTPLPSSSSPRSFGDNGQPEPLLSLLTTSHPLIANTIDTANKAYTTSKKTYPRFKSSAEYVESYLSPVANTVGTVGRATGVHGSIRWFLGGGRRHGSSSSDIETGSRKSQKRRKMDNKPAGQQNLDALADKAAAARPIPNLDMYEFTRDRRNSISTVDTQDTLPAYDDTGRSPAYSDAPEPQNQLVNRPDAAATRAWQQRLIMSTSGLSIAMSKESLRSLKYCLQWLRWANEHIAKTIAALKSILQQYDGTARTEEEGQDQEMGEATPTLEDRSQLTARITELKGDVLKTLREVIDTVSKYTGGALPENARVLVHRHLTSLPQRFRVATMQDASAKKHGDGAEVQEVRDSAQRVLVLAKEGLDMMEQVSGVLDGTIHSAEEWCQRLGKTDEGKKEDVKRDETMEKEKEKEKEKSTTPIAAPNVPGAFPALPMVQ